ncbi:hypothetical protein [Streptomyces sp. 2P-4]|uniref:hypothetical protein n=1 Tax=Streptomyces sp. 2P-4 TaxID=2931974 RepID=UPI00253FB5A2|nr:hypothetical protein [Streptomyces sp. 2P-4]
MARRSRYVPKHREGDRWIQDTLPLHTEGADTMALVPTPKTPTVAVSRELRRLGLEQGPGKDFRVTGHVVKGERRHTNVLLLTAKARQTVADHADDLETWLAAGPFPFTVSVRYSSSGQPHPSIHNGPMERIREDKPTEETAPEELVEDVAAAPVEDVEETAPATVDAPTTAPADADNVEDAETADAPEEPAQPVVDYSEQYKQQCQANALVWSTKQAAHVRAAAAGHLFRDDFADAFRWSTDRAKTGRRVSGSFLAPLQNAGFLVITEAGADGRRLVEATPDGRRAIFVWDAQKPEPTERNHKQERMPLNPLMWGEEAARRTAAARADEERRRVERDAWWAGHQERRAAEDAEEPLRAAWVKVEGITNPFAKRPKGWTPTNEQVAEHALDAEVVAALRLEAAALITAATEAAAAAAAGSEETATDTDPWGDFREGDIVAVEGRPGDWELMARTDRPGVWDIETARADDREQATAETPALSVLDDAPHVRRGDLVLQHYPEQTRAAVVGDVYRLGRWVAVKHATDEHGGTMLDDVATLTVVTQEQLDAAVSLPVEDGEHRGRILEVLVSRHAGMFRVTCQCLDGMEVCRGGRRIGYSSSVAAARALWEWHAAGQTGEAPEDFADTAEPQAPAQAPAPALAMAA